MQVGRVGNVLAVGDEAGGFRAGSAVLRAVMRVVEATLKQLLSAGASKRMASASGCTAVPGAGSGAAVPVAAASGTLAAGASTVATVVTPSMVLNFSSSITLSAELPWTLAVAAMIGVANGS